METATLSKRIEINEEVPYVLIAVYGTLRKDNRNHYILDNKSELLGTTKTEPKFSMFGKRTTFPIVTPNGNTAIEVEVYKIRNNAVLQRLHKLEGFTGEPGHKDNWYEIMEIETEYGPAYMYIQDDIFDEEGLVKSGNWNNRFL